MKVVHIARNLDGVGGLEHYVSRVAAEMATAGYEVTIIHGGKRQEEGDVNWVRIPALLAETSSQMKTASVTSVVDGINPDLVVGQHLADGMLLRRMAQNHLAVEFLHGFLCAGAKLFRRGDKICTHALGSRCIVDWYAGPCGSNISPVKALGHHRQALQHLNALRQLTAVLVPSQFLRSYILLEGIDPSRVLAVDNRTGIGPAQPSKGTGRRLAYVGRLAYGKGVQYLLSALSQLPAGYSLEVIGDGWYRPELERRTSALGLAERVRFAGVVRGAALKKSLRQVDIMVLPSIWPEPAALVVPEARAAGLKVVVSDAGGSPEWASQYSDVFVSPAADGPGLALAIERAARSYPDARPGTAASLPSLTDVAGQLIAARK